MLMIETGDPTQSNTTGQIILFFTFLINIGVQLWREWRTERAREKLAQENREREERERKEALAREERIKHETEVQHTKTREMVSQRMDALKKRFNGLLEDNR
jgi:hypothetical protein